MEIKAFLKSIEGLAVNTRIAYKQTLWQLHQVIKGDEPTDEEIKKFLSKYPASSLHRHKAAIKVYLEFRKPKEPWPFTRREFRKPRRRVPRTVDPELVPSIWKQADNEDDMMFVKTLFMLGCRISELRGIEEDHITDVGVLVIGKGGDEELIPIEPLNPVLPDFLQELREYAKNKNGRKIFPEKYSYYYSRLKELAKLAGIQKITLHYLRHSRAVDLLNRGYNLNHVQQFLRHRDISTTAVYLEITGGDLAKVFQKRRENNKGGDYARTS